METQNLGKQTDSAETIVFDTASGISLEEQREILEGINAMSGGSRLGGGDAVTEAKKKDYLFPLFINVGALLVLGLGLLLFSFFHGRNEQSVRESSAALGYTERKLIQELRRETSQLISEKESRINDILRKLSAADAEYRELQVSVESLSEAQKERAAYLLSLQEEYRDTLSELQNEMAGILEESRLREAMLRSQSEEMARELSQGRANLSAAMEELMKLSAVQDLVSRIEDQMSGYYAAEKNMIASGRIDEASAILETMREFLDAASFQGIRSLETRKLTHLTIIDALERALAGMSSAPLSAPLPAPPPAIEVPPQAAVDTSAQDKTIAELKARNTSLEQKAVNLDQKAASLEQKAANLEQKTVSLEQRAANLEQSIAAMSAQVSDRERVIAEYAAAASQRDSEILALRANNTAMLAQRDVLQQQNEELRNQIAAVRALLQE